MAKVTVRGSSIIIDHTHDNSSETALSGVLNETFPGFKDWSNDLDEHVAKVTADPWVNKLIPFAFLGLAVFKGINSGAVLAGESAFALGYVAFDLYWKFQQENVVRKIEKGLSQHEKGRGQ